MSDFVSVECATEPIFTGTKEAMADAEDAVMTKLRSLERRRIAAIRENDVAVMSTILHDKFLYITSNGTMYDKDTYLAAVGSHQLAYSRDLQLTETVHCLDNDVAIIAGEMLGHARLDGEAQLLHLRSMRVWRLADSEWRLLAWQSSAFLGASQFDAHLCGGDDFWHRV
jgi:hypothetical protein